LTAAALERSPPSPGADVEVRRLIAWCPVHQPRARHPGRVKVEREKMASPPPVIYHICTPSRPPFLPPVVVVAVVHPVAFCGSDGMGEKERADWMV
jgi:hypothetical protein